MGSAEDKILTKLGLSARSNQPTRPTRPADRPAHSASGKKSGKILSAKGVRDMVLLSLDDMKAVRPVTLDVSKLTDTTDYIVVAEGNSKRHVTAIADKVWEDAKKTDCEVFGAEGREHGEWVLIDLNTVVVHLMLPENREYYRLEDLWQVGSDY